MKPEETELWGKQGFFCLSFNKETERQKQGENKVVNFITKYY